MAVTEDRDVLASQRLANEVGHNATVERMHSGTIRIENPDDANIDAVRSVVVHEQRLGGTFALVVTSTGPDGVHIATVGFRLRMDLRVPVHFAGGRLQDTCAAPLGHAQYVDGAHDGGLDRLDRVVLIVTGRRGTRQIVDHVNFEIDWYRDVVPNQFEVGPPQKVRHVGFLAGEEIVQADDVVAGTDQSFAEMGT